jgi:GPI-anchor transamidase subunit U
MTVVHQSKQLSRIPLWVGIAIRMYLIFVYPTLSSILDDRVEVNTPLTSHKRLQEGFYLFSHNIDPFVGGVYHQQPLLLLLGYIPGVLLPFTFIFADYLIAICISSLATIKVKEQEVETWPEVVAANDDDDTTFVATTNEEEDEVCKPKIPKRLYDDPLERKDLIPADPTVPVDFFIVPSDIGTMYLLNPLSIIACVAQSTQIYGNLAMALSLYFASKGKVRFSTFSLALASYLGLYPAILVAPCVLLHHQYSKQSVFIV